MIPAELQSLHSSFWDLYAHNFNMPNNKDGCGQYVEAWVKYAKLNDFPKVENLKKSGSQTQYNGHAVDAFLYAEAFDEFTPLYQAVDIIGGAEGPNPTKNWGVDSPRYTSADIWHEQSNPSSMVPWVGYDEQGFNELKRQLAYDYTRRPQGADWDVSVWASRVFHSTYMGPNKTPLGMDAALLKHRPEWCAALQVPVVTIPPSWNIGDPV